MPDDGKGHTPGPWEPFGYMVVANAGPAVVAKLPDPHCNEDVEEATANVNLIAAAPDLLRELRRLVRIYHVPRTHPACAAIRKARGQSLDEEAPEDSVPT